MKRFAGTRSLKAVPITISAMAPEARTLLDTAMADWKVFRKSIPKKFRVGRPTIYQFAYWLIRYSGLVQPARKSRSRK